MFSKHFVTGWDYMETKFNYIFPTSSINAIFKSKLIRRLWINSEMLFGNQIVICTGAPEFLLIGLGLESLTVYQFSYQQVWIDRSVCSYD